MAAEGAQLATGWLELTVSTAGAQKSMTSELVPAAGSAGDQAGESIGSKLLSGLKKYAGPIAVLAAGFSVKKIVEDSTQAFEGLVTQTNSLQRIAGGTREQVSGLIGAFQLAGVPVDNVSGALTIFSKNLGNAAADGTKTATMASLLGSNFLDASGQVKPMSDILPGLADKFKSMPDGAEKTALAVQLFGRSGSALLPFLNQGSAGIAGFTAEAAKMGLVVDDTSAKILSASRTSLRSYQAATQGLSVSLGQDLVPVLDGFQNIYRTAIIPILNAATGFLVAHREQFIALGDTLDHFAEILSGKVTGGLSGLGSILGQVASGLASTFGPVFANLGPLFAQLGPIFASLAPQVLGLLSAFSPLQLILKALAPVLPQLVQLIGNLASTLGIALSTALAGILPALTKVASALTGGLSSVLKLLIPIVGQLATALVGPLAGTLVKLAPIVGSIAGVLAGIFSTALKALMPIITLMAKVFGQVLQAVLPLIAPLLGLVTPILSLITPLLQLVGPILKPLIGLFVQLLTPILQLITPLVSLLVPVLQVIVTVLTAIVTGIVDAITWFVNLVTGSKTASAQLQAVFGAVGDFFAGIWKNITGFFSDGIKNIVGFFTGLPNQILGALGNLGTLLVDAGKNMIQGLLDGAGSLLKNIGSFFLSILPSWIVAPFKAALGIHSPSTVFAALGGFITQGLVGGLTNGQASVQSAAANLLSIPGLAAGVVSSATSATAAAGFPDTVTLLDADGSILARTKVVAAGVVADADSDDNATVRGGTLL